MPAPDGVREGVAKWLSTQGYPLEMRVAQAFQWSGFTVTQGDYYIDSDTQEPREIDLIATKAGFVDDAVVSLRFVVECKSSKKNPWILFTSTHSRPPSALGYFVRLGTDLGRKLLAAARKRAIGSHYPLFDLGDHPAYGMVQSLRKDKEKDSSFGAAVSVTKAAKAQEDAVNEGALHSGLPEFAIVQPVIVVDGFLFEAFLDNADPPQERFSELGLGLLAWRYPYTGQVLAPIHVVAFWSLDQFLIQTQRAFELLITQCEPEAKELLAEWRKDHPGV